MLVKHVVSFTRGVSFSFGFRKRGRLLCSLHTKSHAACLALLGMLADGTEVLLGVTRLCAPRVAARSGCRSGLFRAR